MLCRLYALVEVLWHQADVILETIAVADTSWGYLLSQIPDLLELLHILRNYSVDDTILCYVEKLEEFLEVMIALVFILFLHKLLCRAGLDDDVEWVRL